MYGEVAGWLAGIACIFGAILTTSHSRRWAFWGWILFFIGNICWIVYGLAAIAIPVIAYNAVKAGLSLRGAFNNTKNKERREKCQLAP